MTDNEIIKAFEICYVSDGDCSECPFYDEDMECTDIGDSYLYKMFLKLSIAKIISISDSQCRPRMYKSVQNFEKSFPTHNFGNKNIKLVEYKEVKHGEWEPIVKQDNYLEPPYCDTIKCSECGEEADVSFHDAKYCYMCGAKMDGERK